MPSRLLLLLVGLCLAVGCARETPSARSPDPSFAPWVTPPGYAWPPRSVSKTDRMHPGERAFSLSKTDPITTPNRPALPSDSLIPGGEACIERLRQRGVRFEPLTDERGVETPIAVHGPLGGVEFWSVAGPMIVDCRLALALEDVGPEFVALGIRRVRFSGAYVYRTSKKGRLSLHAYGLAVDMHEVATAAGTLSVRRDFQRGLGDGCGTDAPLLNQLACRLRRLGLFRELLTPDYDSDHYDHLHLGIAPIPGAQARLTGATPNAGNVIALARVSPTSTQEREVPAQNLRSERSAQVETPRQSVGSGSTHVKAAAPRARVARLGSNLKHLSMMPADGIGAEARNETR